LFLGAIIAGITTKVMGSLKLLDPTILYEEYGSLTEFQFKTDILIRAGEAFRDNQSLVNWKGYLSVVMIACFAAEAVTLWMWITAFWVY
jgi:hypothetical protein